MIAVWLQKMQLFTFADSIDLVLLLLGVILGVGASAVTFRIPAKELFWATAAGFFGWEVMFCLQFYDINTLSATTLGALAISLCSELLARSRKAPASIYVVPGILPLVPGRAIYNAMFATINGHDFAETGTTQALLGAGGIAIGLLIGTSIARGLLHPQHRLRAAIEREQHRHLHSQQQIVRELHQAEQNKTHESSEAKDAKNSAAASLHRSFNSARRRGTAEPATPMSAGSASRPADTEGGKDSPQTSRTKKIHEQIAKRHKHQTRSARYEKRRKK